MCICITALPNEVPMVTASNITFKGDIINLILSWGEPFNNFDPIVNYTVLCSGDNACPPNFTITDDTTRSYIITNLTPMTNYTFSVVATNSIGSGEPGVLIITTPSCKYAARYICTCTYIRNICANIRMCLYYHYNETHMKCMQYQYLFRFRHHLRSLSHGFKNY